MGSHFRKRKDSVKRTDRKPRERDRKRAVYGGARGARARPAGPRWDSRDCPPGAPGTTLTVGPRPSPPPHGFQCDLHSASLRPPPSPRLPWRRPPSSRPSYPPPPSRRRTMRARSRFSRLPPTISSSAPPSSRTGCPANASGTAARCPAGRSSSWWTQRPARGRVPSTTNAWPPPWTQPPAPPSSHSAFPSAPSNWARTGKHSPPGSASRACSATFPAIAAPPHRPSRRPFPARSCRRTGARPPSSGTTTCGFGTWRPARRAPSRRMASRTTATRPTTRGGSGATPRCCSGPPGRT